MSQPVVGTSQTFNSQYSRLHRLSVRLPHRGRTLAVAVVVALLVACVLAIAGWVTSEDSTAIQSLESVTSTPDHTSFGERHIGPGVNASTHHLT